MEFQFAAQIVLELESQPGNSNSFHRGTKFNLAPSKNLDRKMYLNNDDLLTKEGSHVMTNVLVQGILGNLHMAHQFGYRDSAEHLRYIISELERGFIEVTQIQQSTFAK